MSWAQNLGQRKGVRHWGLQGAGCSSSRGAALTGGALKGAGRCCGRRPGSRRRRGPVPARTRRSCGTGCSWQRAPEPPPRRRLRTPGPAVGRQEGGSVTAPAPTPAAGPDPSPPGLPSLGLGVTAPSTAGAWQRGRKGSPNHRNTSPCSNPTAPVPGPCLVVVQQQLQNGLPGGEEVDLLDDVHPVVHMHSLVQAAVVCKHKGCAEWG